MQGDYEYWSPFLECSIVSKECLICLMDNVKWVCSLTHRLEFIVHSTRRVLHWNTGSSWITPGPLKRHMEVSSLSNKTIAYSLSLYIKLPSPSTLSKSMVLLWYLVKLGITSILGPRSATLSAPPGLNLFTGIFFGKEEGRVVPRPDI